MDHSLTLESRIKAFVELGKIMGRASESLTEPSSDFKGQYPVFYESLHTANHYNPWFTTANIAFALKTWQSALNQVSIQGWVSQYKPAIQNIEPKKIAAIMAGNIPLVGFHDFISTLMAGHSIIGKLSSEDKILLPAISDVLCTIEPSFKQRIEFTESTIKDFDAIIATGSNNTARYFEYYFTKYPHIIRKNRNGVAVLSGGESDEALQRLGSDICTYFGLGCRNVTKVFLPAGSDPSKLFNAIEPYVKVLNDHYKFMNNHSYYSSVYLLNTTPHLDNGVFILTESEQYSSPIPVLYYQFYENIETLKEKLLQEDELIQCVANDIFTSAKTVPLGSTQCPGLTDYADGIDTMKFLLNL
jgi:hypothetical protein